ncbi:MAG: ion transporter [Atopobiaceae bacterium]|nr:ion transporter [Atopobiaceae bacterium]MCH4213497.1 ion transporter [Atopobiaceae bacterium]MCH4229719.1 ion transporter [Atopobiaceae bacterium]MCI1226473.1 ion transporter [Atopobiaceae bacterium]MCI1260102.1 ion transporter [Atopobiaceae bacterium]
MTIIILVSMLPLCFKEDNLGFSIIEYGTVTIFIVDYALRWMTSDLRLHMGARSFFLYPFTPMAIVDLLTILPAFNLLGSAWKVSRLLRLVRVMRAFKLIRYSKSLRVVVDVLSRKRQALLAVLGLAVAYILISALVVFNVEPNTFRTLFDAIYWAVISLTTVGYGDIYPTTMVGRTVAMISSLMGVAVVALPSSIITVGLLEELHTEAEM